MRKVNVYFPFTLNHNQSSSYPMFDFSPKKSSPMGKCFVSTNNHRVLSKFRNRTSLILPLTLLSCRAVKNYEIIMSSNKCDSRSYRRLILRWPEYHAIVFRNTLAKFDKLLWSFIIITKSFLIHSLFLFIQKENFDKEKRDPK